MHMHFDIKATKCPLVILKTELTSITQLITRLYSCACVLQNVLTGKVGVSRSLSWHHHLPLLAVAGDGCVHVWFIDTV